MKQDQSNQNLLTTPYQGILYVEGEVLGGSAGTDDSIDRASIGGQGISITWRGGRQSTVTWDQIRAQTNPKLPRPRLVFVHGSRDIGLYFASATPTGGLLARRPNSVIESVGWLSARGFSKTF